MATLNDLIRKNKQRPIRRAYIKRRSVAGVYEASWVRIDNDNSAQSNRILDWGSVTTSIDSVPGQIGEFSMSELAIVADNKDGYFNVETDYQSKWYPENVYLNRKFTKLKIEVGYLDSDDTEVGVAAVFEGIIDRIIIGEDQVAKISALPYQSILTRYSVDDLSWTGTMSISAMVNSIMNQAKITTFIPYVAATPDNNIDIDNTQTLTGTYWDILKRLAMLSNSVPIVDITAFSFVPRDVGAPIAWEFHGLGSDEAMDIMSIDEFDDEGAESVRLFWQDTTGTFSSMSSNTTSLLKYLSEPQSADISIVKTADKQDVLDTLMSQWEVAKPTIRFTCRFLVNTVTVLNKITIEAIGAISPKTGVAVWDNAAWDDGSVWGKLLGAINIVSGVNWMVTEVSKNMNDWTMSIRAEKVV